MFIARVTREGWPLLNVKTEVNGAQRVQLKGPFLGWFVGLFLPVQDIFVLPWLLFSRTSTKNFFLAVQAYTILMHLSPSASKLGTVGRQSCWVACLLMCFSGYGGGGGCGSVLVCRPCVKV